MREIATMIAQAQREIEKMFRDLWARLALEGLRPSVWEPPVDVVERDDEIVVFVDVPGFSKDDVKIKVAENGIEVFAQRSTPIQIEGKYILRQRLRESLHRRVDLPVKVRPEQAKARLENGVLEVRLPKSEVAREIQIIVE